MRTEYLLIGGILALILCLTVVLIVGVLLFSPSEPPATQTTTSTTITSTSTTSSTTTKATTVGVLVGDMSQDGTPSYGTSTTSRTTTTSSTTLPELPELAVGLPEGNIYRLDDVDIRVYSDGGPVEGVLVSLDGKADYLTNEDGVITLNDLQGGLHALRAVKEGYETAYVNFSVYNTTYAYSSEVRVQHTPEERNRYVSEGKTVLIFFDLPNCVNCAVMRPWIAGIVNENRGCIEYEWLNIIQEGPKAELRELIEDESSVSTPVIIVQGSNGRYMSAGYRTKAGIEAKLKEASDERCPLK